MNQKVLVLDIDGTLTNVEKEITPITKKAIIEIQERGHLVILASGRPTPGMQKFADELKLEYYGGYLLSFNGGCIINCKTGEIVFQRVLPSYLIPNIYNFAKKNDCGIVTYLGDYMISGTRRDQYISLESSINHMDIKDVDNFPVYVDFDVNKCLLTAEPAKAAEFEKILNEKYGEYISVYRSEPFFIEIMPKNIDKATSLDRMLNSISLKQEDTICCGDGFNDMTMIKYAGIGVAMDNAQPAVKDIADYVTKSNNEDGIAHVIEKFIL